MRKLILLSLLAVLPVDAGPIMGGACATGTAQEWIDLGSAGCAFPVSGIALANIGLTDLGTPNPPDPDEVSITVVHDTATSLLLSIGKVTPFVATDFDFFAWQIDYSATIPVDWQATGTGYIADGAAPNFVDFPFFSTIAQQHDVTGALVIDLGSTAAGVPGVRIGMDGVGQGIGAMISMSHVTLEFSPVAAPEPATMAPIAAGLLWFAGRRLAGRRRG